jgi:oligoribonuclease
MLNIKNNLIWLDLEMTGLNPDTNNIIELSTIITDKNLNILDNGKTYILHQDISILNKMDEWNTKTHTDSGLYQEVLNSKITEEYVEKNILLYWQQYIKEGIAPLCGNSIGHDRKFLHKFMPKLNDFCSYRIVDVSSIKELVKRWYPKIYSKYIVSRKLNTNTKHRANNDIISSIDELKFYYKECFLK